MADPECPPPFPRRDIPADAMEEKNQNASGGHLLRQKRQRKQWYGDTVLEDHDLPKPRPNATRKRPQPRKKAVNGGPRKPRGKEFISNGTTVPTIGVDVVPLAKVKGLASTEDVKRKRSNLWKLDGEVAKKRKTRAREKTESRVPNVTVGGVDVTQGHLRTMIEIVGQQTTRWEMQLEQHGEHAWSAAALGISDDPYVLPIGGIDWVGVATELSQRIGLQWTPRECQRIWKFAAYADVGAVAPRAPGGADPADEPPLEDSDVEDMDVPATSRRKKDLPKASKWVRRGPRSRPPPADDPPLDPGTALLGPVLAVDTSEHAKKESCHVDMMHFWQLLGKSTPGLKGCSGSGRGSTKIQGEIGGSGAKNRAGAHKGSCESTRVSSRREGEGEG
ncbi:unnamed protein product, partial [Discosporangium mesarthrocarpum]